MDGCVPSAEEARKKACDDGKALCDLMQRGYQPARVAGIGGREQPDS
jgi:hypothetical protein